jgi:hypothetical protein
MVVTVSDLALIVLKPTVESFAQEGISPHRMVEKLRRRVEGSWRIDSTGWRRGNVIARGQNIDCPFMGRMSEMPGPLYKKQGGASLLDKDATRFGEFDRSSLVAIGHRR